MKNPYIQICRIDHWVKNLFILPGFVIAHILSVNDNQIQHQFNLLGLLTVFIAVSISSSANYCINEFLDIEFDKLHPKKTLRVGVQGKLIGWKVWLLWAILVIISETISIYENKIVFFSVSMLLIMGLVYNVKPIRSKDFSYIDVLTESINNPIRLVAGWAVVIPNELPPLSLLLAYWMGGAFLMALKRFAEFRSFDDISVLRNYRKSFIGYSEVSLITSAFLYAILSVFFLSVFLFKYRIEFIICIPFLSILYVYYFKISFDNNSIAESPEKLIYDYKLIVITFLTGASFIIASLCDIENIKFLLIPVSF